MTWDKTPIVLVTLDLLVFVTLLSILKLSLSFVIDDLESKKSDLPQIQNYFHCEYKVLPDDKDVVKTDVVTFGMAAKMYSDNDSRVLRTWLEKKKTWIAWTHKYVIAFKPDLH